VPAEVRRFTFTDRGWIPELESRAAARDRILANVREALEAKLDGCEAIARQGGWRAGREKRHLEKHIGWLVEYQLRLLSFDAIAARDGVQRKSVEQGVKDAAKLLGLTLRARGKGGRPPGISEPMRRRVAHR
jgi:hypothetical protein